MTRSASSARQNGHVLLAPSNCGSRDRCDDDARARRLRDGLWYAGLLIAIVSKNLASRAAAGAACMPSCAFTPCGTCRCLCWGWPALRSCLGATEEKIPPKVREGRDCRPCRILSRASARRAARAAVCTAVGILIKARWGRRRGMRSSCWRRLSHAARCRDREFTKSKCAPSVGRGERCWRRSRPSSVARLRKPFSRVCAGIRCAKRCSIENTLALVVSQSGSELPDRKAEHPPTVRRLYVPPVDAPVACGIKGHPNKAMQLFFHASVSTPLFLFRPDQHRLNARSSNAVLVFGRRRRPRSRPAGAGADQSLGSSRLKPLFPAASADLKASMSVTVSTAGSRLGDESTVASLKQRGIAGSSWHLRCRRLLSTADPYDTSR